MVDDNKPPLDEALLAHFGVPGMHWGHRKPQAAPVQKPKKSRAKKIAIGVGVAAGVTAAAVILGRSGNSRVISAATTNHLDLGPAGGSAARAAQSFTNHLDLGSSVVNSSSFSHVMNTPLSASNVQSLYDIARGG